MVILPNKAKCQDTIVTRNNNFIVGKIVSENNLLIKINRATVNNDTVAFFCYKTNIIFTKKSSDTTIALIRSNKYNFALYHTPLSVKRKRVYSNAMLINKDQLNNLMFRCADASLKINFESYYKHKKLSSFFGITTITGAGIIAVGQVVSLLSRTFSSSYSFAGDGITIGGAAIFSTFLPLHFIFRKKARNDLSQTVDRYNFILSDKKK